MSKKIIKRIYNVVIILLFLGAIGLVLYITKLKNFHR